MTLKRTLKQLLPSPYRLDLSLILRCLNRRTPQGRERLANSPVTAAYLAAAMGLIQRHLGPGAERTTVDPEDKNSVLRRLLSFLTQRAVAKQVARNPHPFHRRGNVSTLRSTWKSHSDFIADLLRFGLWAVHYPALHHHEVAAATEQAIAGEDCASAIHKICYWDSSNYLRIPTFRLQLVAAASSEGDEVIQEAISERYAETTEQWKIIYARFLQTRGLQLRPGVTLDACADLLAAVAEGLALRQLANPNCQVIDHDRQRSLLGTAALALIRGCLEPTDTPDSLTLEQAVEEMVRDHERVGARQSDSSAE